MSKFAEMTIKQLVEAHNSIEGVEPIANWKGRKDLLVEKVVEAMKQARAKRGARTIREASEELLIAVAFTDDAGKPIGHPYDYILERVLEEFPDATTTVKCLRWYNTKLNSDPNVRMPVRPRKKAQPVEDKPGQAIDLQGEAEETETPEMADPLA